MTDETNERKTLKRKVPCKHEEAEWDGNTDWPGFCTKCGKEVDRKDYE